MKPFQNATLAAICSISAVLVVPLTTSAAEATFVPADENKDGIVTRQEHLDYWGKMWDSRYTEMAKADKGMQSDRMTSDQYNSFYKDMALPDGRVNPGKVGGR